MKNYNRRKFLSTAISSAAISLSPEFIQAQNINKKQLQPNSNYMGDFAAPKLKKIRMAIIGVGGRGHAHVKQLAYIEGTEIVAICDLHEDLVNRSVSSCLEVGNGRHQNLSLIHI